MSTADIEHLRWYLTNANDGRGRIVGVSARLHKAGLLTLTWTSMNCWVLTLSARGKKVLELAS